MKTHSLHWPEYAIEAAGLGLFMVSAGLFATLLFSPTSPIAQQLPSDFLRGALMGIAMGLTAIAIIYSPWGQRSGAHINPAITLTFFRLGKLTLHDTLFYMLAQFVGGVLGVMVVAAIAGTAFTEVPVHYIVTIPGPWGWGAAIIAEASLAFGMMLMVLIVSNNPQWSRWTGVFAGLLVAVYITFAAPISGMSINPARSFASALPAQEWQSFWIYYLSPPLAMLAAAELYLARFNRHKKSICCKLCPNADQACISCNCCCDF